MATQDQEKLSPVEGIKTESHYLRGSIATELAGTVDAFDKSNAQLLKFHGTYQQDDRDARAAGRQGGSSVKSDKDYYFMVRTKVPGGKLSAGQLLAELDLADELGNATLRCTTRQGLQLHGVSKGNLKQVIRRINDAKLSTLAACGDVERNIMCCPAPHRGDPVHDQLQALTDRLAEHLCPRTRAYYEIWLHEGPGSEQQLVEKYPEDPVIEPIYGPTYLPRKFKTAIGLPGDNCVDMYANDLALMALCRDWRITGYNVLVGGGFGVTPSAKKTFPAVAQKLARIDPEQAVDVATAIIKVQRDFGNRSDRKVARMKYLIHDWGLARFKAKVEEYYGERLPDPDPEDVWGFDDHLGWHPQGDGRWFYGLNVENGRILDRPGFELKTALREVLRRYQPEVRVTSHQSLLFCDLAESDRETFTDIFRQYGVPLSNEISTVRRWSMACVAWPTCGLSITEAERALPGVIDQLERELARLGLPQEVFTVRMTGCPNGCARPYNSDVGLVGKALGKYTVLIGGRLLGDRLNFIYKDLVPLAEIVPTLVPLLVYFKQARTAGETFGDFCHRRGQADLTAWAAAYANEQAAGGNGHAAR